MVESINESLYSRQLYVLGYDAMEKMLKSVVLLLGLDGLGQEIGKNICLAGIKKLYIFDKSLVTIRDLCTGFYFSEKDIGKRKDIVVYTHLKELNPYVEVEVLEEITEFYDFKCVVSCNYPIHEQIRINNICRHTSNYFIGCQSRGVFSQVFCDFGDNFKVLDVTGEIPVIQVFNDIDESGILTMIEKERHNLEDGDSIKITDNKDYENKIFTVEVINPYKIRLLKYDRMAFVPSMGGYIEQQKKTKTLKFEKLDEVIERPIVLNFDYHDTKRSLVIHNCFRILSIFEENSRFLRNWNDFCEFYELYKKRFGEEDKYLSLIKLFIFQSSGSITPICSVIGGFVAQEVLKSLSGKFHPLFQFLYFDSASSLPEDLIGDENIDKNLKSNDKEFAGVESRYDPMIEIFGRSNVEKIFKTRIFIVGAGAIGCEHAKNVSMMGCGKDGAVYITDMDSIENSNLNRQFLFRSKDVSSMKAEVLAREITKINPDVRIISYNLKVGQETEDVFNDEFFESKIDLVANALDNVEARLYIDSRIVFYRKPLFDSGTLGTKGNSQVILPLLTESYSSSQDPPEKSIPLCTIRNFPHLIEHAIEWALNQFTNLFHDQILSVEKCINELDDGIDEDGLILLSSIPMNSKQCVEKAVVLFTNLFNNSILSLLDLFPPNSITAEGIPFWTLPKRPPVNIVFDCNDDLHMLFILSSSNIFSYIYNSKRILTRSEVISYLNDIEIIGSEYKDRLFDTADVVDGKVSENLKVDLDLVKFDNKLFTDDCRQYLVNNKLIEMELETLEYNFTDFDFINLKKELESVKDFLNPTSFEKDDDSNHHLDFIYTSTNLRANNYKIQNGSKHVIKGIAGRIIPAIATTTSIISGVSVLEMIKFIFNKDLEDYKNTYVNLALPYFATSTPIEPMKYEYFFKEDEKKEFNLWDRIVVKNQKICEFIEFFRVEYEAVIYLIMIDSRIIYIMDDSKYLKNIDMAISELSTRKSKFIFLDVIFESDCEEFPPIVVDLS